MYKNSPTTKKTSRGKRSPGLDRTSIEALHEVIQLFLSFYDPEEAKLLLYDLFRCWLVSDSLHEADSTAREHMVFFYEQLGDILEIVHCLEKDRVLKGAHQHYCFISPFDDTDK